MRRCNMCQKELPKAGCLKVIFSFARCEECKALVRSYPTPEPEPARRPVVDDGDDDARLASSLIGLAIDVAFDSRSDSSSSDSSSDSSSSDSSSSDYSGGGGDFGGGGASGDW